MVDVVVLLERPLFRCMVIAYIKHRRAVSKVIDAPWASWIGPIGEYKKEYE